jgi:hypothetical protein
MQNSFCSLLIPKMKSGWSQTPVAHAYNPSYSGDRDWKDHGLKPVGKHLASPYRKYPSQKVA